MSETKSDEQKASGALVDYSRPVGWWCTYCEESGAEMTNTIEPTEEQREAAARYYANGRELTPYTAAWVKTGKGCDGDNVDSLARLLAEREHKLREDINSATNVLLAAGLSLDVRSDSTLTEKARAVVAQHERVRGFHIEECRTTKALRADLDLLGLGTWDDVVNKKAAPKKPRKRAGTAASARVEAEGGEA